MKQALNKIPHEIVKKDPVQKIINKLAEFKNHSNLPDCIKKSCHPPVGVNTPRLFGQVKTHKEGMPIRLLVAKYTAPTINVERTLAKLLQPLFNEHKYCVNNSKTAIDKISNINPNSKLYSLDVVSLFPNTPVNIAIKLIGQKLKNSKQYNELEI